MQPADIPASSKTLRDEFAAWAMASVINRVGTGADLDDIARTAYSMADAMLVARARAPTSWPDLRNDTDFLKG